MVRLYPESAFVPHALVGLAAVFRRSGRYDPDRAAITTFVYAVGNNAWLTHLRRSTRDQARPTAETPVATGGRGEAAVDAMGEAEQIDAVRACLCDPAAAGLTEQERTIVRCIAAGESDRGLARRLGISCSTVNVRKHAGLVKIRQHLETYRKAHPKA